MQTLLFIGNVYPISLGVTLHGISPKAAWRPPGLPHFNMDITTTISQSIVNVSLEMEEYRPEYLPYYYIRAMDFSRACANIVAFGAGLAITVVLETFVKPDGSVDTYRVVNPQLANECTAFKIDPASKEEMTNFGNMLLLVAGEPHLFIALNELIQANTLPHSVSINCGRAVEGIRVLMAPPGTKKKEGWDTMRSRLNFSEDYLGLITGSSTNPRHGNLEPISGPETSEVITRTWIVMNRFLEYRKSGNKPLPKLKFPPLDGPQSLP